MTYSISDIIGNLGVFIIIITYLLLQMNKINSDNIKYSLMNLVGASLVIISLVENFNMSAFLVEAFWVGISLFGLIKYFQKNKLNKRPKVL
jgi:hypothetical protein